MRRFRAHASVLPSSGCLEVVIVCWRPACQSVIEEKGEGFENGKRFVGSLGVPSTSVCPPITSEDLRYYISNKPCAFKIKGHNNDPKAQMKVGLTYRENAFENLLLRNAKLLREPTLE
jgi:hypothetical protein